jgi:hypothetical protein
MQYTVPQFIDQEDKIVGPITVRQFLIMIVAAIIMAIAYAVLRFWYFVISALVISLITIVVAFVKVNGRPFHFFIVNIIQRMKRPPVRVWDKKLTNSELRHYLKQKEEEKPEERARRPRLTTSHLSQLSLIVDSGGSYEGEDIFESVKPPPPLPEATKK